MAKKTLLFVANFEQKKYSFMQKYISDIESSNKYRMYRDSKTVYKCEHYMDCNIRHDLRVYYTQFRLSSHTFLVERAQWHKDKIPYHEIHMLIV